MRSSARSSRRRRHGRCLRAEYEGGVSDPARLREILTEALGHLDLQLSLVHRRAGELAALQLDLESRRARVERLLSEAAGR